MAGFAFAAPRQRCAVAFDPEFRVATGIASAIGGSRAAPAEPAKTRSTLPSDLFSGVKVTVRCVPPLHWYFASVATAAVVIAVSAMSIASEVLLAAMIVPAQRACTANIDRVPRVLASFLQVIGKPAKPETYDDCVGRF
jgi:hypothetical protein